MLWQKMLSRLPESVGSAEGPALSLTNADVAQLAAWDLNGREIKNAIKAVRTWCLCKGYQISLERLESGILVTAPQAKKFRQEI